MEKLNNIPCLTCDKEIESLDPSYTDQDPSQMMWNDGVVTLLSCGYGSRFDTTTFVFGMCDECIQNHLNKGKIASLFNG